MPLPNLNAEGEAFMIALFGDEKFLDEIAEEGLIHRDELSFNEYEGADDVPLDEWIADLDQSSHRQNIMFS